MTNENSRFSAALEADAHAVETRLQEILVSAARDAPRVWDAMRYAALAGGKRLRPFLVLESARLTGADSSNALEVAAALECVHCYSLVHDDLPAMDDDDVRRGRPTCHIAFDEATAILAGDGLLTLAFDLLSSEKTHDRAQTRLALIRELAQASGANGMVGGQMLDLEAEGKERSLDETLLMQGMKTGRLLEFACSAGAILADEDKEGRVALRTYGSHIGLAFQIADDLLDAAGSAETVGKATGKDTAAGKATFVGLLGMEGARNRAEKLISSATSALAHFGSRADTLVEAAQFVITRRN